MIGVITNPYAGKNKTKSGRSHVFQAILGDKGEVKETRNLEQLKSALEEFYSKKAEYIVCDGGDGTIHWALNTFLEIFEKDLHVDTEKSLPIMVPTNGGTIDFLAEKANVVGHTEKIIKGMVRKLDDGDKIDTISLPTFRFKGKTVSHDFEKLGFVAAIAGVGQKFFEKYYSDNEPSSATIVKVIATAVGSYVARNTFFKDLLDKDFISYSDILFESEHARVVIDGKELPFREFMTINAGSIMVNLKGVVKLFPKAATPGSLHVQAGNLSPTTIIKHGANIYRGPAIEGEQLAETNAKTLDVYSLSEKGLNPVIDGEIFEGLKECHLSMGPNVRLLSIQAMNEK